MPSLYVEIMSPILFIICWVLIAFHLPWFPIGRTGGTMVCAVLTVALGILSSSEAFAAISLETLSLLFGSMLMSAYLEREGFFLLVQKGLCWGISNEGGYAAHKLLLRVCLLSGGLSALVTNDTTCVVLTPLLMGMVARHSLPPAPFLLALATAANIGSSCSPVGNPQNMLIASASGLEFKTFLSTIFVSAAISMAVNIALLLLVYHKQLHGCNIVWTEAIFERVDDKALHGDEKKNSVPADSSSDPAHERLLSDRSTQYPAEQFPEVEESRNESKKAQPSDSHVVDIPLSIQLDSDVSPLPAERNVHQRQLEDSVRAQLQQAVEVQERIETALQQGQERVTSPSEIQLSRVVASSVPSPPPPLTKLQTQDDVKGQQQNGDRSVEAAVAAGAAVIPETQLNLQEEWARNEYVRRLQLSFFYSIETNPDGLSSASTTSTTAAMNTVNPPLTYTTPARYALPTFVIANRRSENNNTAESKRETSGLRMVPPEYEKISSPYTGPTDLAAHSNSLFLPLHSALHKYRSIPRLYIFSFILLVTVITFLVGLPLSWCALGGGLAMVLVDHKDPDVSEIWRQIDWSLLLFFSALFIVVEGLHASGWPQKAWDATQSSMNLSTAGGVAIFTLLVILGSNTVSNVPLVLILSPALKLLPDKQQKTAWLLLAFVSTLAGNLTLIGSVANLIVAARARKWYTLTFWEYTKFGLPSTLLMLLMCTPIIPAIINA